MSGQPSKTQADVNKFRNEYMETLNLQEQINDMNLQANKTYLLTGQLPPQSQMQDTRTNAEKLKDFELLKHSIAKDLSPIAEPQFAYDIVNAVNNSPLNLNGSLIRFLAQRANTIAEELKKSYQYGIAGDANDLEQIVQFIRNMYADQQGKFQSTKSYFNSLSSEANRSSILSANDINKVIEGVNDLQKNISIVSQRMSGRFNHNIANKITLLMNTVIKIKNLLPTTEQLQMLMREIDNPNTQLNYPQDNISRRGQILVPNRDTQESLSNIFKILDKLPKYNVLMALMGKIKMYINLGDFNSIERGLDSLLNELSIVNDPTNQQAINNFINHTKAEQQAKIDDIKNLNMLQTRAFIRDQEENQRNASQAAKVYIVNPMDDPVYVHPSMQGKFNPNGQPLNIPQNNNNGNSSSSSSYAGYETNSQFSDANPMLIEDRQPSINSYNTSINSSQIPRSNSRASTISSSSSNSGRYYGLWNDLENFSRHGHTISGNIPNEWISTINQYTNTLMDDELVELINSINNVNSNFKARVGNSRNSTLDSIARTLYRLSLEGKFDRNHPIYWLFEGQENAGNGLMKRRRGRPRGSGLVKVPPPPKPQTFVGFGVNEINQKQLDKGILKIRRNTKSNYVDMPSKRISSNLQGVIKTILGGGMPKYEELGKLDEDEKEYLHKIVSRSNMEDKLSIPAPSKDQQEKDIHNFEVFKGQIMAGNDSKELVKKFKLLVRKLSKQGLLPKNDVEEINDILTDLGY